MCWRAGAPRLRRVPTGARRVRGKLVHLTAKRNGAQAESGRVRHETEQRWRTNHRTDALGALRSP